MLPKIGFSLEKEYDRPMEQVLELLHDAGFSAVSPAFSPQVNLSMICECAETLGMTVQSLHAPNRVAPLWSEDGGRISQEVMACLEACAAHNIPVMVLHSWQGLDYTFSNEDLLFDHFDRIVAFAQDCHIAIAFENLEGEEYLEALMARYKEQSHIGFCWDSGHEHCYPHKMDFLEKFGNRLMMTHLNDNLGLRDPNGLPSTKDDLHLLPGDGTIDWEKNFQRLKNAKQQEILNFEIKTRSATLPLEEFLQRAGAFARRFAETYKTAITKY